MDQPTQADRTGIVVVDKPVGWTSHDVVAKVRRLAGQKRVGHAGTLDPLASGVLPVLLGRATRLMELVQSGRKAYRTTVALGRATGTDDGEGSVIAEAPVPGLSAATIEGTLAGFRGEILQTPPPYSALKVDGQRAYVLARRGESVTLAPRAVTIDALELLAFSSTELELQVVCSRGTYIRALARDVARALGTVGYMSALRRTSVGPFSAIEAWSPDQLAADGLAAHILSAQRVLPEAPLLSLNAGDTRKVCNGQSIQVDGPLRPGHAWVYDPDGRLLCLGTVDGSLLRPLIQL